MKKGMKILLALFAVLFAVMLAGCVALHMYDVAKKQYVTDPVIAHIPLRAELTFFAPALNQTADISYILTPSVDLKVNVSEGLILPEGIVFVENNLPTGQITLSKGKKYKYDAKIKAIEIGNWTIYAAPGVYANVNIFEDRASVVIRMVFKDTVPLTRFRLREKVAKEHLDILKDVAKESLKEYDAVEYEKE